MKSFLKGILLGLALFSANKLCCGIFEETSHDAVLLASVMVFFVITFVFLVSKNIRELLVCGFCGLFVMFAVEINSLEYVSARYYESFLVSYLGGFLGAMAALAAAIFVTLKKLLVRELLLHGTPERELQKSGKYKLIAYAVATAVSFSYLVMPEKSGLGVLIFALIQTVFMWFLVPDRKRLWLFIPVLVMAGNSFWSANVIWRLPNLLVSVVFYAAIYTCYSFKGDSMAYIVNTARGIAAPFLHFALPFRWASRLGSEKAPIIKRAVIAAAVAIPCVVLLVAVLVQADMVFSVKMGEFVSGIGELFEPETVCIIVAGICVGLYLFGMMYGGELKSVTFKKRAQRADLIIINTVLFSILAVYTIFVIIQFKYLFAGSALPEGLTYSEYARKGFFELLALTGVNLVIILAVVKLTTGLSVKGSMLTKLLCHYLLAVTAVLLISSFYRMSLYTNDGGLTRMRLYVMGFLIFEAVGVIITFFYIAKPKFNITLIYICLALVYYMVLNIVPTDNIIAREQAARYMRGEKENIGYIFELSADAVPAMLELYEATEDAEVKENIRLFILEHSSEGIRPTRRSCNIAVERAKAAFEKVE